MLASPITTNTPRVWIGCLSCYNKGILVGDWFDADAAYSVTMCDVHRDWVDSHDMYCEEMWCLDSENFPVNQEMSPNEAQKWGDAYNELDSDHLWPAYCAWVDSGMYVEDTDGVGSISDFLESYSGSWNSFREFSDDFVENTGMLSGVPEELARYFDYGSFSRDLKHDYTVVNAPESGVFIFCNF